MKGPKLLWLEVHHDLTLAPHRDRAVVGRKLEPQITYLFLLLYLQNPFNTDF